MIEHFVGAVCTTEEFAENLKIDFSSLIRKKGSIDYLPWAEIVRTLHKQVSNCTYGFKETHEGSMIHYTPTDNAYLRPYLIRRIVSTTGETQIVETPPGFFPVSNMAARHKAMSSPDIRAIDNCLRRAIAKEIGIHTGIGLALWAASDPFDEIEDAAVYFGAASTSRVVGVGTEPPAQRGSSPAVASSIDPAAEAAGLTDHGKQTIAIAVRADSWKAIPADKAPKIVQLLADPDKVSLFNSGRNSQGKVINPMAKEDEVRELVAAFEKSVDKPKAD